MKKGNIIDLIMYRNQLNADKTRTETSISEELQKAIQLLIERLKTHDPHSKAN